MLAAFALILATTLPSATRTAWMDPAAFHLRLNMPRAEVTKILKERGWTLTAGKEKNHLILNFDDKKTVTLGFFNGKLHSLRFEFVDFAPEIKKAFDERQAALRKQLGAPSMTPSATVLLYDKTNPNIFVVMSVDPKNDFGRQGLGFLVVRYFDPAG